MQERVNDNKHEPETHPRAKKLIRTKCIEELRQIDGYKFTSASSFRCPTPRPEPSETERIKEPPTKLSDQSFGSKLPPSLAPIAAHTSAAKGPPEEPTKPPIAAPFAAFDLRTVAFLARERGVLLRPFQERTVLEVRTDFSRLHDMHAA